MQDLTAPRRAFLDKLARAADAAGAAAKARKGCPSDLRGTLHAYPIAYARHLALAQPLSAADADMRAFRPPWPELLQGSPEVSGPDAEGRLRSMLDRTHAAIVTTDEMALPAVEDDKSFVSGEFAGWVYVIDLASTAIACAVPLCRSRPARRCRGQSPCRPSRPPNASTSRRATPVSRCRSTSSSKDNAP
jgi:hypothetical protein